MGVFAGGARNQETYLGHLSPSALKPERDRNPWERRPDETLRSFGAFKTYRDMGAISRSMVAAYRKHTKRPRAKSAPGTWQMWARKYAWGERAALYDVWIDELKLKTTQETYVAEVREMATRQAREAMALQRKGLEALQNLKPEKMSARDILEYITRAGEMERIAKGIPKEIEELATPSIAVRYVDDWRGTPKDSQIARPPIEAATATQRPALGAPEQAPLHVPLGWETLAEDDAGDGDYDRGDALDGAPEDGALDSADLRPVQSGLA